MNIQASPLGEKGKPEKRIAFCATMGAETPFHLPLFYHFFGAAASGTENFSPIFQKCVRDFLNLSKRGRIIEWLNDIIFGGSFS
jgi:hypothetical protein